MKRSLNFRRRIFADAGATYTARPLVPGGIGVERMIEGRVPSVLLVEDEAAVLAVLEDIFAFGGFEISTASTASDALDLVEKSEFDLVVSDIELADGPDGIELARIARLRRPTLKFLFISGRRSPTAHDRERDNFMEKPFHPRELLGCAWEVMTRKPSSYQRQRL